MTKEREALSDLGQWVGVEAHNYVKIMCFVEGLVASDDPNRDEFMKAFYLVHNVFKRVVND